jgi:hypothetical protein
MTCHAIPFANTIQTIAGKINRSVAEIVWFDVTHKIAKAPGDCNALGLFVGEKTYHLCLSGYGGGGSFAGCVFISSRATSIAKVERQANYTILRVVVQFSISDVILYEC